MKKVLFVIIILLSSTRLFAEEAFSSAEDFVNIKADNVEYVFKESKEIGVFTGNVSLEQNKMKIYGDKIQIYVNEGKIFGEGNIKIASDDNEWKFVLTGGKGEYDKEIEYAKIVDSPKLIVNDKIKKEEFTVIGEQMEMFSKENKVVITQNVHIIQKSIEAWGENAVFFQKEKKLIITGNAKVLQRKNIFNADKITYYLDDDKVMMGGNVKGFFIKEKEKKNE